jgi:adenosylcobinamide kinase/adenosylcobinamide-phosphate guanylyltransferase
MGRIILITGGARSGKSRYALELASGYGKRAFIATAEPVDDEMKERIKKHRLDRGPDFITVEEPVDLAYALDNLPPEIEVAIVDCLTVWLGNLQHREGELSMNSPMIQAFLDLLKHPSCDLIIVTNEVGSGIVPSDPGVREFRDTAGLLNQEVTHLAHRVILTVCGIPVVLKGKGHSSEMR